MSAATPKIVFLDQHRCYPGDRESYEKSIMIVKRTLGEGASRLMVESLRELLSADICHRPRKVRVRTNHLTLVVDGIG